MKELPVKLVPRHQRGEVESSTLVAMPAPAPELDRAGRANFFHSLSREAGLVAIRAAIAAGVELIEAKAEHAGGFQKWVESKCAFSMRTAQRYMELAQKTLPESSLPLLLEGTDADREEAIEAAATSTDSRTLTDLYVEQGIVKRTPSKMGGARPGSGRPKKSATETTDPDLMSQESLAETGAALADLDRILGPGGGATLWNLKALKELKDNLLRLARLADGIVKNRLRGGR